MYFIFLATFLVIGISLSKSIKWKILKMQNKGKTKSKGIFLSGMFLQHVVLSLNLLCIRP